MGKIPEPGRADGAAPIVVHVLASLKPSGAEAMLASAATGIWMGDWIHVILTTGEDEGEYAPVLRAKGYGVRHLPFRRSLRFFINLWRTFRALRPSVVHVHRESGSFYVALVALLAGARCVRTLHAVFDYEGWLRLTRGAQRRLLVRLGVRMCACSELAASNETLRFGYRPKILPNWYDEAEFTTPSVEQRDAARQTFGVKDGEFAILSVGNCSDVKSHASIIEAISRGGPQSDRIVYLHCGVEDRGHKERALAEQLGVAGRTRFLGPVTPASQACFAADAYLMTSVHEGFSIATVEAAATGLPCILTNTGVAAELAAFGAVQIVDRNPQAIADALDALMTRPHAKAGASDLAEFVRQRFSSGVGRQRYLDLYQTLCSARNRRHAHQSRVRA